MQRLATAFVLGYHGCDAVVADKLLAGTPFKPSDNDYDWLGPGIYFWEANPRRGLQFAQELADLTRGPKITSPTVIGAVIDLGLCLDLTTAAGVGQVQEVYQGFKDITEKYGGPMPKNSSDMLRRRLDCAVIKMLHRIREQHSWGSIDSVRGLFIEGEPIYEGSGIYSKTHTQICVRNPLCIKGVFRVPENQLTA